ncbi:MAG: hypothetical protein LUH18_00885, partial [Oscillospiraceae bacterium]|nr:hypothetical protein [Oscillospiraceae bacterium]
ATGETERCKFGNAELADLPSASRSDTAGAASATKEPTNSELCIDFLPKILYNRIKYPERRNRHA